MSDQPLKSKTTWYSMSITMDHTKKMLQAIINGQSAMKAELLTEIRKVDKKVDSLKEDLTNQIGSVEDNLQNE